MAEGGRKRGRAGRPELVLAMGGLKLRRLASTFLSGELVAADPAPSWRISRRRISWRPKLPPLLSSPLLSASSRAGGASRGGALLSLLPPGDPPLPAPTRRPCSRAARRGAAAARLFLLSPGVGGGASTAVPAMPRPRARLSSGSWRGGARRRLLSPLHVRGGSSCRGPHVVLTVAAVSRWDSRKRDGSGSVYRPRCGRFTRYISLQGAFPSPSATSLTPFLDVNTFCRFRVCCQRELISTKLERQRDSSSFKRSMRDVLEAIKASIPSSEITLSLSSQVTISLIRSGRNDEQERQFVSCELVNTEQDDPPNFCNFL